ncbi:hypothetical protein CFOL_v3_28844, partial [Cephalotus follicularis]
VISFLSPTLSPSLSSTFLHSLLDISWRKRGFGFGVNSHTALSSAVIMETSLGSRLWQVLSRHDKIYSMEENIPQVSSSCWCFIALLLWLPKLEMDRFTFL